MSNTGKYDTFLAHSHHDSEIVECLALKLNGEHGLKVWLDRWIIIPGEPFVQSLSKGLDEAKTCVVVIGRKTPKGWFSGEIQVALNRQSYDPSFRVIPLLLPGSNVHNISNFLKIRSWIKFEHSIHEFEPYNQLLCGIKGTMPGRPCLDLFNFDSSEHWEDLKKIRHLFEEQLIDKAVKIRFQSLIVNRLLNKQYID